MSPDPDVTPAYYRTLLTLSEREGMLAFYSLSGREGRYLRPPVPVSYVWETLRDAGVPEDEIEVLRRIPLPKPPRAPPLYGAYDFGRDVGKSVAEDSTLLALPSYGKILRAIAKAVASLPSRSRKLFDGRVRKIVLRRPRGTEDASWEPGGVLSFSVRESDPDPKIYRLRIVHELGHAAEEALGVIVTPWNSVYGSPPFVSDYAARNATEDFAETFAGLEIAPRNLKKVAPSKYSDMVERLGKIGL